MRKARVGWLAPALLLALLRPAAAQTPQHLVSLDAKDASLNEALASVLRQAGVPFIIGAEPGIRVSARLEEMPLDEALRSLTASAGLVVQVVDGIYLIRSPQTEPVAHVAAMRQTPDTEPVAVSAPEPRRILMAIPYPVPFMHPLEQPFPQVINPSPFPNLTLPGLITPRLTPVIQTVTPGITILGPYAPYCGY